MFTNLILRKYDDADVNGTLNFEWVNGFPQVQIHDCFELADLPEVARALQPGRIVAAEDRHTIECINQQGQTILIKDFIPSTGMGMGVGSFYVTGYGIPEITTQPPERFGLIIHGLDEMLFDSNDHKYDKRTLHVFNSSDFSIRGKSFRIYRVDTEMSIICKDQTTEEEFDALIMDAFYVLSYFSGRAINASQKFGYTNDELTPVFRRLLTDPNEIIGPQIKSFHFFPFPDPTRQLRFSTLANTAFSNYQANVDIYDINRALHLFLTSQKTSRDMKFAQICIAFDVIASNYTKSLGNTGSSTYFPQQNFNEIKDAIYSVIETKFGQAAVTPIKSAMVGKIGALNNKSVSDKTQLLAAKLSITISGAEEETLKKRNKIVHWGYINSANDINRDLADIEIATKVLKRIFGAIFGLSQYVIE